MSFINNLKARGLIQDISDEDGLAKLGPGDIFYVGFDPTAASLQIGNLVPLIVSIHLAQAGLKPLILFGGATGLIGDPSGKDKERQLLSKEIIAQNIENQKQKASEIFERAGTSVEFVNNLDWTQDMPVLEFLRDIGKHFTVNYMLSKEVVKTRLDGAGISFTEFSYMVLQSFDFLHLFQAKNCRLQIGGSDQWGNITSGLELIRRKVQGDVYAFSIPLITNSQGKKFGKSEEGAIWMSAEHTSPYKFHQFWLNIDDQDVIKYLRIFTFLEEEQIITLQENLTKAPEKREAQRALADAVCDLVHGPEATQDAKKSAQVLFGGSLEGLSKHQLEEIFSDVPSSCIASAEAENLSFLDLLAKSGLVSSKGEGRRLITSGGAYLNNQRISDANLQLKDSGVLDSGLIVLRSGKKKYHLVKLS